MDFNSYCRECGSIIHMNEKGNYYCNQCQKEIERKNVVRGWVKEARITQLKAMHQLMSQANDESIYMSWIYLMPDCPSEEDFVDIAFDDDMYNECFDKFVRLIQKDGNRW